MSVVRDKKAWLDHEIDAAFKMREGGKTSAEIALALHKTRNSVCGMFHRLGSATAERPIVPRTWSDEEYDELLALRASGMTMADIATKLKRSETALKRKLEVLRRAGWHVPPALRGDRGQTWPSARSLSKKPFWELDENERRLVLWWKAKDGAAKTRSASV